MVCGDIHLISDDSAHRIAVQVLGQPLHCGIQRLGYYLGRRSIIVFMYDPISFINLRSRKMMGCRLIYIFPIKPDTSTKIFDEDKSTGIVVYNSIQGNHRSFSYSIVSGRSAEQGNFLLFKDGIDRGQN
ncbi:hypothetical protein D3C80_1819400 [compost metagenome]